MFVLWVTDQVDGHVVGTVSGSQAGEVVVEDDVEHPMEAIFDVPVGAHGAGEIDASTTLACHAHPCLPAANWHGLGRSVSKDLIDLIGLRPDLHQHAVADATDLGIGKSTAEFSLV